MKKFLFVIGVVLITFGSSSAGLYMYNPNPADMYDLDHYSYYEWGIDHDFSGETISSVRLTISNVNNWRNEPNFLFMHLLDNASAGLTSYVDSDPTINDAFAGQGIMIDAWTDTDGGPLGDYVNLTYDFGDLGILDDFAAYAADGNFGLGFDPDCHFFNDKVQLTIVTDAPEPTTMVLFALGLIGGGVVRKKFKE